MGLPELDVDVGEDLHQRGDENDLCAAVDGGADAAAVLHVKISVLSVRIELPSEVAIEDES